MYQDDRSSPTLVTTAQTDAPDTWDSDFLQSRVPYGSSQKHPKSSFDVIDSDSDSENVIDSTSGNDDDVDMHDTQADKGKVLLIGRDGSEFHCTRSDIEKRSTVLLDMITWERKQARIRLQLPKDEVSLLADTMSSSDLLQIGHWQCRSLEYLVRALELYEFYGCSGYDIDGIQMAILEQLRDGTGDPRFALDDARFALKLRALALYHDMSWLLSVIDQESPAQVRAFYGGDDDLQPRKWRKVSKR